MPTLVMPVARIDREVDRGRNVGPAVGAVTEMHRQLGEVGLVAGRARPAAPAPAPRETSNTCGVLRSRRWISATSPRGSTPNARASRVRPPATLATSSCRSGPAARNSTARALPSSAGAMSARSSGSAWTSSSLLGEALDESPQAEALEVRPGGWRGGRRFFDDVHARTISAAPSRRKQCGAGIAASVPPIGKGAPGLDRVRPAAVSGAAQKSGENE